MFPGLLPSSCVRQCRLIEVHFQLHPQFVGRVEAVPRAGAGSLCEGGRAVINHLTLRVGALS